MSDAAASGGGNIRSAFGAPFAFVGRPLKWLIGLVALLAGIAVLVIVGIFVWNTIAYGGAQAAGAQTSVFLGKIGAAPLVAALGSVFSRGISGELLFEDSAVRSDIAAEQGREREVKVKDVQIVNKPVFYGKNIFALASLSVKNPPADLELSARCGMDDALVDGIISAPGGIAKVFKGTPAKVLSMTCTLPPVQQGAANKPFSTAEMGFKEVIPPVVKRIDVIARFPYTSTASLGTYVYNAGDVANFLQDQSNAKTQRSIFAAKGINDPQIGADGTVRSIVSDGPLNIGIQTASQPLVENTLNILHVSITPNLQWDANANGKMKKLESFTVSVPNFILLGNEAGFPQAAGQTNCDFISTGEVNERGEKMYEITPEKRAMVNKECSSKELKGSSLTVSECKDIFGIEQKKDFYCSFVLTQQFSDLKKAFIEARANYLYEAVGSVAVTITPQPGIA